MVAEYMQLMYAPAHRAYDEVRSQQLRLGARNARFGNPVFRTLGTM